MATPHEAITSPEEIAYVNGRFMPLGEAVISIEDRGFQFADGVYEVVATYRGQPYAIDEHMRRLQHSLGEIRIDYDVEPLPPLVEEGIKHQILRCYGHLSFPSGRAVWRDRAQSPRLPTRNSSSS